MIIKLTLVGLLLVLISVIALSYYVNKEGFDDISNGYLTKLSENLESAVNTVTDENNENSVVTDKNINKLSSSTSDNSIMPIRNEVIPEVSISGSGYKAMNLQQRAELLKDIQKLVRNEIIANRNTSPIISGETRKENKSNSTEQGKEYENSCYKDTEYRCPKNPDGSCPPVPDMSQYIRKDQIPCWGCSLDY
jgi:hypothetical protein